MNRKKLIVVFLALGIIGIYGFPLMKGTFYNILAEALKLDNLQLGRIWSVFGIVGMVSYIFGGYFADRVSPKKIICGALILSAGLHVIVSFAPSYALMLLISGLMGVAAIFSFFPASTKILNRLGEGGSAGVIFGGYYALEGVGSMLVNTVGSRIYMVTENAMTTFTILTRMYAVICIVGAVGTAVFYKEEPSTGGGESSITLAKAKEVLKDNKVWLIAAATFCNYLMVGALTYITPYLTNVFHVSDSEALWLGILRVNVITIAAGLIFGKIADKLHSAVKVINRTMYVDTLLIAVILANGLFFKNKIIGIVLIMCLAFAVSGVKTISLVMVSEAGFAFAVAGTVIGAVSFIGYSPDAFFFTLAGWLLERFGESGYNMIFAICLACALGGIVTARILFKELSHEKQS